MVGGEVLLEVKEEGGRQGGGRMWSLVVELIERVCWLFGLVICVFLG